MEPSFGESFERGREYAPQDALGLDERVELRFLDEWCEPAFVMGERPQLPEQHTERVYRTLVLIVARSFMPDTYCAQLILAINRKGFRPALVNAAETPAGGSMLEFDPDRRDSYTCSFF